MAPTLPRFFSSVLIAVCCLVDKIRLARVTRAEYYGTEQSGERTSAYCNSQQWRTCVV